MDKFTKVTGVAAPLMRQNVDTDLIIRIERLVFPACYWAVTESRREKSPHVFHDEETRPHHIDEPEKIPH